MGVPEVNGPKGDAQYTNVTFHDKGNDKKVQIQIPIGAKIGTTTQQYEVKGDGIYLNGKKLKDIEIPLTHFKALSTFDVNKDGKIDLKDSELAEKRDLNVAGKLNEKLDRSGSRYYVKDRKIDGGSFSDAGIADGEFAATFRGRRNEDDIKEFSIILPKENTAQGSQGEKETLGKGFWSFLGI